MSKNNEALDKIRHSTSHILAYAVRELFGEEVKFAIGPTIDDGFYYDFDLNDQTFTPEDLKKIEKKMEEIIKKKLPFEKSELSIADAEKKMSGQPYKLELTKDLAAAGESTVSFYTVGDFTDLCRGPHVETTKELGALKLMKIAGAYWKGNEKNKMLQRIYGTAFETKDQLAEYLKILEEAEKRDHRKLGKELGLISFHDEGPGFPFFKPKGMVIWNELLNYWREMHEAAGYDEIKTPIMLSQHLWETSGHWTNYRENMYETIIDETKFAIKPMNCPGGFLMYKEDIHSYRELPLRWGEIGLVHRHELSGVLSGLFRVRAFHQDDAHIFMRPDQIKDEILGVLNLVDKMYATFGLTYTLELSTKPEKAIGSDEAWETATAGLTEALNSTGKEYEINEGDGAFYGPKIDIKIKDAIGRTWQCGTIQLDMNMPDRFDLTYTDSDGQEKRPVMIHRVIYGSMERFFGVLIEHFAGAFPLWLSPVQAMIIPVSEKFNDYGDKVFADMKAAGIRVEIDKSDESLGKRIRNAEKQKTPYILVVGEKEVEAKTIAVRKRSEGDLGSKDTNEFIEEIKNEIADKK
ncbi:MAG: threonine--tRNA ligase [Candidatus Buchananbacteria bacterium]